MRVVPGRIRPRPSDSPGVPVLDPERLAAWREARRVLAVRLDAMGDLLMTGPALRALKTARKDRKLALLTSPEGGKVARLLPGVDELVEHRASWMKPEPAGPEAELELIERLRRGRYDGAVIFTVYSQNPLPAALLTYLARIPLRIAFCRENPYHLLSDRLPEPEPEQGVRHEVRRHLDLAAATGGRLRDERIRVYVGAEARREVGRLLAELLPRAAAESGWLVVHPGASAPSRRYPPELFAPALSRLWREDGLLPVFTGSAGEAQLVAELMEEADVPGIDLSGRLGLEELAALLERAPLLLSNNTGPVHMAAGVGTAVVDLYALTNPQHAPWGVPSEVLYRDVSCRFCYSSTCPMGHHACLRGVAPDEVVAAVRRLLLNAPASSRGDLHAAAG